MPIRQIRLSRQAKEQLIGLHLHRGIGYLATPGKVRSIADLVGLASQLTVAAEAG